MGPKKAPIAHSSETILPSQKKRHNNHNDRDDLEDVCIFFRLNYVKKY